MNDNDLIEFAFLLLFAGVCYALGRAHRPRRTWEDGYQKGLERSAKDLFRTAVRATAESNSAARRFRPPTSFRARATPPARAYSGMDDQTTVVVKFPNRDTRHQDISEAA